MGELLQSARRDAVGASLVFLQLLEGKAECGTQLLLAHCKHLAAQAHAAANVLVDGVWGLLGRHGGPLAKAIEQKSFRRLELSLVVSVCHVSIFGRNVCLPKFLEITRRASTRPKSEKPRKSREGNRTKRLKRQQQERKEKYRKRQCRANKEQRHQLSKLSATHDVQPTRRSKEIFHGGASHTAPNPTPRKE